MIDLTAIILTYNEEVNIVKCISSIKSFAKRIVVIDSFSNDDTVSISQSLGAEVYQNPWINYATQYQYAINTANISTKWILRIDADEEFTEQSASELIRLCVANNDTDVNGIVVRFEVNFLNRKLRHGGIYPFRKLLVYKNGIGEIEKRNMDEHIILKSGKIIRMNNNSLHHDFKGLSEWIDKHNKYASREVADYIQSKEKKQNSVMEKNAKIKRVLKFGFYYKLPLFFRSFLYFNYRYFIKLGFLDGRPGLIYAFLQAFWYRFLVDAKIYEERLKHKRVNK